MNNKVANDHIRPDLKVTKLARLAFSTYLQPGNFNLSEIELLQDSAYCRDEFSLPETMPVLIPVAVIEAAPPGNHVGQRGFLNHHWWAEVFEVNGVEYRVVNEWKDPPSAQENRTALEDWIRRMGMAL